MYSLDLLENKFVILVPLVQGTSELKGRLVMYPFTTNENYMKWLNRVNSMWDTKSKTMFSICYYTSIEIIDVHSEYYLNSAVALLKDHKPYRITYDTQDLLLFDSNQLKGIYTDLRSKIKHTFIDNRNNELVTVSQGMGQILVQDENAVLLDMKDYIYDLTPLTHVNGLDLLLEIGHQESENKEPV